MSTFKCIVCARSFEVPSWEVKRGRGRFCQPSCYHAYNTGRARGPYKEKVERVCAACGGTFLAGGRGGKTLGQRLCSDECRNRTHYRHGRQANQLSVVDAAYLAGIVDGEGSIMLIGRDTTIAARLTVSNTSRALMDWIAARVGIGNVQTMRDEGERNQRSYAWLSNGDGAMSLLRQLRPYLVVKTEQADLAIATEQRLADPALKSDRSWQPEWRARMKHLNRRGPRELQGTADLTFGN